MAIAIPQNYVYLFVFANLGQFILSLNLEATVCGKPRLSVGSRDCLLEAIIEHGVETTEGSRVGKCSVQYQSGGME